ncbi:MAG: cell wall metabolism sensor histidine kinase WalK [Peptococcaceae bacterium]|nr:cell wall metabolism sensor histidine kinase WalK [Peptococcaceae bacterium]
MLSFARRKQKDWDKYRGIIFYMILGCFFVFLVFTGLQLLDARMHLPAMVKIPVIALTLAGFFHILYHRFLKPLIEIVNAAEEISLGLRVSSIPISSRNELGKLAYSINGIAKKLRDTLYQVNDTKNIDQAILSSMTDGVIALNPKGEVLFINHVIEDSLKINQENSYGQNILGVIRNYEIEDIFRRVIKSGQPVVQEIKLIIPEPRFFRLQATPLVSGESNRGGVLMLLHDITERRQLEEMRTEFVTNISHELRTPLTSIKGFLETLLSGAMDNPETANRFLNIIYKETERLSNLVNELLNLSKIEGRRVVHRWQKIQLNDIINTVANLFMPQIQEKQIELDLDLKQGLPLVFGDPDMITQVLINFVDNALKYTPSGGKINIRSLEERSDVRVVIWDTGIGIPPESLPRVFERFYRVDKARARELGGIGVGLAIVKHIVRAHGGQCFAESEVGKGSIFSFTLPAVNNDEGIE